MKVAPPTLIIPSQSPIRGGVLGPDRRSESNFTETDLLPRERSRQRNKTVGAQLAWAEGSNSVHFLPDYLLIYGFYERWTH